MNDGQQRVTVSDTIHVSQESAASDDNPGTAEQPVATIQEAVDRAMAKKHDGSATRVEVAPGIYREAVEIIGDGSTNDTPIEFEATHPGSVVVSGADIWTDWEQDGDYYVHEWPHEWTDDETEDLTDRREMVVVDGELLTPVMQHSELEEVDDYVDAPGSFYVDDENSVIVLDPPAGTDVDAATVEVGVRKTVWDHQQMASATVRGFVFTHAVPEWHGLQAAVRFEEVADVTIEDCQVLWNNWVGLHIRESTGVRLERCTMNHNGGMGLGTWHVKDFTARDNETSYNNWRGALAEHFGWDVGNKIMAVHGMEIQNHLSVENESRGLWFDYDIGDAEVRGLQLIDNRSDGLWIEANQGPIAVRNSLFAANGRCGIRTTYSENITVEGNLFYGNGQGPGAGYNIAGQIGIAGHNPTRDVDNFTTGETMTLKPTDWTIRRNVLIDGADSDDQDSEWGLLANVLTPSDDNELEGGEWEAFLDTLTSEYNTYYSADADAIGHSDEMVSLPEWQSETGQDSHSTWTSTETAVGLDPEPVDVEINAPSDAEIDTGDAVPVRVTPRGDSCRVVAVDLFVGDLKLPPGPTPYETTWVPTEAGEYTLQVRIIDSRGAITTESQRIRVQP